MKLFLFLLTVSLTLSNSAHSKTLCGDYKTASPCRNVMDGSECATEDGTFGACIPREFFGAKASCDCVLKFERVVEYGKDGPIMSAQKCNRDDSVDGCQGVPVDSNCIIESRVGICVPSKQNIKDTTCVCVDRPEEKVVTKVEPILDKSLNKP